MTSSPLAFIGIALRDDEVLYNTEGCGVLDLGATETVGSLEAVENLMRLRAQLRGEEDQVEVFHGPSPQAIPVWEWRSSDEQQPQKVGSQTLLLGMFILDAEKVPILIGMKTLLRLGAVIDVSGWMVSSCVAPKTKIPLRRTKAGHLVVSLTGD